MSRTTTCKREVAEPEQPDLYSSETSRNTTTLKTYPISSPFESLTSLLPSFASSSTSPPNTSHFRDPVLVGALSALGGIGLTVGGWYGYRMYWRRIRNSDYVTTGMLESKRWVKGVVTSVGDGDNFRLYHTPGPFFHRPLRIRNIPQTPKELKDETIHIRIAGCDAPEAAHFGNPAQPHSKESLDWLRRTVLGKTMRCQLVRKDQYNRIVAVPYIRRLFLPNKPLPVMMLHEGMAVVYESGGGEYGPWGIDRLKEVEAQAKAAKKGLWSLKSFEHPADYKRRIKMAEEGVIGVGDRRPANAASTGWWGEAVWG